MPRALAICICLLAVFIFVGCASFVKGTQQTPQTIKIASQPNGARVEVFMTAYHPEEQKFFKCESPCVAKLKPYYSEYIVRFQKEGYKPAEVKIIQKTSGWFYLQRLIPVIGWLGEGIDVMSGSNMTLVPRNIKVILEKIN